MIKVLVIGQLPKEIGGNYTTGAANVVYELSKQKVPNVICYTFGTNIKNNIAYTSSSYSNQYLGYRYTIFSLLKSIIFHPIRACKHIFHYCKVDHQNIFRYLFYEVNIRETIKKVKPDIIHVHSINNLSPTRFALNDTKTPILLTCHGIFFRGDASDYKNRDRFLGNIHLADAYSGLTQESCSEYEGILGISKEKITVISNGVDCNKFYFSKSARDELRKKYCIDEKCFVFITVASIQERKGQLDFLKVLKNIGLDYQYWIIGNGPNKNEIIDYVHQNNLEDNVKFMGYVSADSLYKFYSAADIYVHSSWKEGQALSEIEANATGLRIIINKSIVGTIASDPSSENYYILDFNKYNITHLKQWIYKYSQTCRISHSCFDWSIIAAKYAALYEDIIVGRK